VKELFEMLGVRRFRGNVIASPLKRFRNGVNIDLAWVHCNGETSYSTVIIASYHHPRSITWRWALYYARNHHAIPNVRRFIGNGSGFVIITLPFWLGELDFRWQAHMMREKRSGHT